MTPTQIAEFVDRLDGAYPAARLFVKNINKAFSNEKFMQDMTVDEGRKLFDLVVRRCEIPPSLYELKSLYITNIWQRPQTVVCELCDNTGWYKPRHENGTPKTRTDPTLSKNGELVEYEYVVRCRCQNVD